LNGKRSAINPRLDSPTSLQIDSFLLMKNDFRSMDFSNHLSNEPSTVATRDIQFHNMLSHVIFSQFNFSQPTCGRAPTQTSESDQFYFDRFAVIPNFFPLTSNVGFFALPVRRSIKALIRAIGWMDFGFK